MPRSYQPLACLVFLVLTFCLTGRTQVGVQVPAMRVTLCDLAKEPDKYAGTMVKVSASVGGRREPVLNDFATPQPCPTHIMVLLVFPEDVKPVPEFDLEKDGSFEKFQAALSNSVNIDATFEGRFDSVFALKDGKRVRIARGYGKKKLAQGRLVLRKVSDVAVRHIPRR